MEALVIGCGVSGLSTAICLQEAGWRVKIWTAALPPDTTSSVAAAIWYPYKAYPEDRVLQWGGLTYAVFQTFARNSATGVQMRENIEVSRTPLPDPWWRDVVPDLRRCVPEELPPGYVDGLMFTTPVIEMPVYLRYLMDRFTLGGGTIDLRMVHTLSEATGIYPVVFNCTGLGSYSLVHDTQLVPIRGQIVRVENPGIERTWLDEDNPEGITYIVPRTKDCILGGTAVDGVWDMQPDPAVAAAIVRRCAALEPRLADAPILEHKVGLRPGRPAIRLEREDFPNGTCCIHNYGHGGAGVTLSWGCAAEAVQLIGSSQLSPGQ
ncbi:MAG TPA: FAD-dependent oxidoreductase [Herpetosiphonaceae bacterium]